MILRQWVAFTAAFVVAATGAEDFAQGAPSAGNAAYLSDSASPFGLAPAAKPEDAAVEMPELSYRPDQAVAADFDKYFAFHRDDTDVDTAFADLVECDSYARGLNSVASDDQAPYVYVGSAAGAVGAAIGAAMADAVFGSAERRRLRRVNMRMCMNLKGYDRYGLPKVVWDRFNFDEGLSSVGDPKRYRYLRQQAMVASAGRFQGKALGL